MLFFFQAEDGIRDLVRSRGLGDVYKRQVEQVSAVVDGKDDHGGGKTFCLHGLCHLQPLHQGLSLIHI